jgi:transposase
MTPGGLVSLGKQELIALILAQQEQICRLSARVAELEARLNLPPKTPSNSSLPPSKGQKANQPDKAKTLRKGRPGVARKPAETISSAASAACWRLSPIRRRASRGAA